ncbi:MAG TPA: ABC transporter ATP-binding protein [Candidatus Sutterella merdavium]|nr:ABC transporter ATP-binding protein [Candidatus Sutterella merdavium]
MLEENTKKSPILEVEGLTVRRADGAALLEDVSLTVNAGEILGLVGESSAGKSMIGNAVAGLLPAGVVRTGGRIALEGREIQNLRPEEIRRIRGPEIGMILQDPLGSLNPLLTVGEHFRETFAAHGVRLTQPELRARSAALLREAGLPEPEKRLGQYPHELSGGLRQRVVIALAVALDPILLVADEPTTALDVSVQAQITALLRRLAKERGCAVLLITHDMGVIAETTDRTAVLYSGRVVEEGDTESLMKTPQHPYTKGLMGSIPDTESSSLWLEQIDGVMPDPAKRPSGCPFHPRCLAAQKRCETERPELADCGGSSAACWLAADNGRSVPDSVVRFHPPLKRSWKTLEAGRLEALGTAPEILRVEDVRKIFTLRRAGLIERLAGGRDDVTVAVDGVTLSVRRGETVALVGESGCGKSTFARIAAGLLAPDGGKVTVNGKDVKVLGAGHVNMIFQDPYASLNPRMSVAAIWEEPLKSLRPEMGAPERRAKLRELARLVGLPEEALEKYPHEFSGGQRQRISIARAVAAGPDLLICDEPTSALDVSVQAQVLNLLKTLQLERGLSMLFISHNLGVVRHIADTVGVMYRGQIVEWAPKEALFEDPLHPYTRMLLDSVPRIDGGKRCTAKHAATEGDVPDGCPFAPRCAEARLECRSGKVFLEVVTGAQGLRKVACRRMW